MLMFPYPVKFIAANKREFAVRVTKPTKRSFWIQLLNPDGTTEKVIKISKTSEKLFYPTQKGGLANGRQILRTLLADRKQSGEVTVSRYDRQKNRVGKTYAK